MQNFQYFRNAFSITQEQLSSKLSVGRQIISFYESGKSFPTFKVLKSIIEYYQISFDFFLLKESCNCPKNLKLLNLAKKLDNPRHSEARNHVESSARSFLGSNFTTDISIIQDSIDIELSDDFHKNLKELRNLRNMTQLELGQKVGASRIMISQYELTKYPPYERLIQLSNTLNVSIHTLATGQKLSFDFQDRIFGQTMLLADHFLSLDDHKVLIRLMESAINNN